MFMKKHCLFILIICFHIAPLISKAQDSLLINFLIKRIAEQQVQQDAFFLSGIYPSYISKNENFSTRKKDNNIFFNGLVAYTLKDIKPGMSRQNALLIDSTLNKAIPLYARFKNKERDTYNFWRTDSTYDYPYAGLFNPFSKKITLPDDMDDTVLSLLALTSDDSTATTIHSLMQKYVNSDSNKVRSLIAAYDTLPAYSTWFGKKFPVVFDVSVLCNVLAFVQTYSLPWTKADSASLEVIVKTIQNNYHVSKPMYASPYYPKASLILYNIARLMNIKAIPALDALKIKLVTDAAKQLLTTNNLVEKIILSNAILKWGYAPPEIPLPAITEIEKDIEQNDFCFFVGNIPSYFKDGLKKIATEKNIGLFYHYCPAYNDALLLEYLILKTR